MGIGVVMSGNLGGAVPDDDGEDPLPGLEPDEPAQPTESAQPIEPKLTAGERIDRAMGEWAEDLEAAAESHQWADKELDDWFEDDFGGNDAFWKRFPRSPGAFPEDVEVRGYLGTGDLRDSVRAYEHLAHQPIQFTEMARPWSHMGPTTKAAFRRGWEDAFGADPSKWSNGPVTQQPQKPADHYQAAGELSLKDAGAQSLSGGPEFEKTPAVPDSGVSVPRWIWVGGGLGVLGLVLAAGFFVFGGSDNPDSVAATEPAVAVEDPATAVEDEPVTALEDAPDVAVEEPPAVAVEEDPAVAVEDEPAVAVEEDASSGVEDVPDTGVADPFDLLTVVETSVLADPAGDLLIEAAFVVPWPEGTPSDAEVYDMFVQVGIAFDGQFNAASWSVTAGKTRGVGYIYGDAPAAIDGELWLTPDGVLFGKLPGPSSTSGLSASALGPDAVVSWDAYVILEEGGEIQRWNGEFPLGEIGELSDTTPPGAQRVETEFGPVELVIPGG